MATAILRTVRNYGLCLPGRKIFFFHKKDILIYKEDDYNKPSYLNFEWITNLVFQIVGIKQFSLWINNIKIWSKKFKSSITSKLVFWVNIILQIVLELDGLIWSRFLISSITLEFRSFLEIKLSDPTITETKFVINSLILHGSNIMFSNQGNNTISRNHLVC